MLQSNRSGGKLVQSCLVGDSCLFILRVLLLISLEALLVADNERYSNCTNCQEPRYAGIDHMCYQFAETVSPPDLIDGWMIVNPDIPINHTWEGILCRPSKFASRYTGGKWNDAIAMYTEKQTNQMIEDALAPIREAVQEVRARTPGFCPDNTEIVAAVEIIKSAGLYGGLAAKAIIERNELQKQNEGLRALLVVIRDVNRELAKEFISHIAQTLLVPVHSEAISLQRIQNS